MSMSDYIAVTISRQLGSGGSYLGQQLARRFEYRYLDREILRRAAEKLGSGEEVTVVREERERRTWETMMHALLTWTPETPYLPPSTQIPANRASYDTECEVITSIAESQSIVVVGHGGFYVLQDHPRLISIFCHASPASRIRRVMDVYQASENEATAMIEASDQDRERYVRALCGRQWNDARNYQLSLDTSSIDLKEAVESLTKFIIDRLVFMSRDTQVVDQLHLPV